MAGAARRGYGEDSIYFDHRGDCRDSALHKTCAGRWRGVVSLGFDADGKRVRRKVSGKTKAEVKDKLKTLHSELDAGLRSAAGYTVSYQGVPVEEIARLAGHASSRTTEVIYRRELRPVITTGAEVMDQIFRSKQQRGSTATAAGSRASIIQEMLRHPLGATSSTNGLSAISELSLHQYVSHRKEAG